jgi:putative endonuclease
MYYEDYNNITRAIEREKNLRNWHREWQINLIRKENPELLDLSAFR